MFLSRLSSSADAGFPAHRDKAAMNDYMTASAPSA